MAASAAHPETAPVSTAAIAAESELVAHLLSQNAPRAAARLSAATAHNSPTAAAPANDDFSVDPACVVLVDSAAAAAGFVTQMRALLHGLPTTLGVDLEWQPDTPHATHLPSLLQLASATTAWLLDLEVPACCTCEVLDGIAALLASSEHRILGFGFQGDLDRLQLVYPDREASPLLARRVVDLRDACLGTSARSSEAGLAGQLRAWTGRSLSKAMQCSDWAARPLSDAQVAYAAADAMSLLEIDQAIGRWAADGCSDPRLETALEARRSMELLRTQSAREEDDSHDEASTREIVGDRGFALVAAAVESLPCEHADACWLVDASTVDDERTSEFATEINALCFTGGPQLGEVLVLVPTQAKVDLRWLSLVLNHPKRKLRLASEDECTEDFGAIPGRVPPLPLRAGIRVLCDPRLRDATELWGSSCHKRLRLMIRKPRFTLPTLVAAAAAGAASAASAAGAAGASRAEHACEFAWLPSPTEWYPTLDDAIDAMSAGRAASDAEWQPHSEGDLTARPTRDEFSWDIAEAAAVAAQAATAAADGAPVSVWRPPAEVKLIVDPTLSVLARKLRMVGIDCRVAGEGLRSRTVPGGVDERQSGGRRTLVGLSRVTIDGSAVDGHLRLAALDGRLLLTTARRAKQPTPGTSYRLLATTDASKQVAEVLTLLQLTEAVNATMSSRCGICNGSAWQRVRPSEVEPSQVPKTVLRRQPVFYRCGVCSQLFWPCERRPATCPAPSRGRQQSITQSGNQPISTTCPAPSRGRQAAAAATERAKLAGCADGAADVEEWRPSSQVVMALGSNARHGGQMMREARGLHSTLRLLLDPEPQTRVQATYLY